MAKKIETIWEYSPDKEVLRVLGIAQAIASGFFKIKNWLLVPYGSKYQGLHNVITFPDLPYNTIHRFWQRAFTQVSSEKLPVEVDPNFLKEVSSLLEKFPLAEPKYQKLKDLWEKVDDEVYEALAKVIPDFYNKIDKIIIEPTVLGAWASFDVAKKFPTTVRIYLREDATLSMLVWSIISDITRNEIYSDLEGSWEESQIISDWLITKSTLSEILSKYEPKESLSFSLKYLRTKQNKQVIRESQEFYKKLGAPLNSKTFEIVNEKILANNKSLEKLAVKEESVLRLLIDSHDRVISFDEIGNYIFDSEDDFSPWAIAKFIQRLRDKLEENGISGSIIQTVRGQGYLLKN